MSDCSGGHHLCADDNDGVCAEQSNSNAVLSALNRKRKEGGDSRAEEGFLCA